MQVAAAKPVVTGGNKRKNAKQSAGITHNEDNLVRHIRKSRSCGTIFKFLERDNKNLIQISERP